LPPPRLEPELANSRLGLGRDALKARPSGGRAEKARGADGRGPENGLEPVRELELEDELPVERGREAPLECGRLELALLLNDFFGSIYCSKRPVFAGLN